MKTRDAGLKLTFEYEDAPIPRFSILDAFADIAETFVRHAPTALPRTAFFEASKAVDWFGGATLSDYDHMPTAKIKRLRAITLGSKPLIEHSYGPDGYCTATTYPDNVVVNYGWDERSRLARVWTSTGHHTTFHFRPDDHIESITYDGYARFEYDYDSSSHITSVTYPDGVRLDRSFGSDGRLASVGCGTARITCRWNPGGDLEEYTIEDGSRRECFLSRKAHVECILTPARGNQRLPAISVHPFGVWQFGAEGHLDKVLAPWGERCVCTRSPQNLPLTTWGTRGLQRFSFSPGNVLHAIITETGQRLCFHTLEDPARVLLVTTESVTVLEYDKNRRLAKLRGMDGSFCRYKRNPNGEIQRIETGLGNTKLAYDAAGRILSATLATGATCVFRYGESLLRPDALLATGQRGLGAMLVRDVTMFCWSWLGIRGTLRLETEHA